MKPERRLCNSKKKRTNSTREEVCVMEMHRHVIWLIVAFYEPPICNHDDGMHVSFITVYIIIFFHTNSRHLPPWYDATPGGMYTSEISILIPYYKE